MEVEDEEEGGKRQFAQIYQISFQIFEGGKLNLQSFSEHCRICMKYICKELKKQLTKFKYADIILSSRRSGKSLNLATENLTTHYLFMYLVISTD